MFVEFCSFFFRCSNTEKNGDIAKLDIKFEPRNVRNEKKKKKKSL